MRILFIVSFLFSNLVSSAVFSDNKLSVYFANDSINGFIISDAYETHNMGLKYDFENNFISLDLGIVSPDMHVYKNEYRIANRSFGEIVTVSLGSTGKTSRGFDYEYYGQIKSSGSFGIDEMQDFMHRLLTLQPVNYVNDMVRMPDRTWIGLGGQVKHEFPDNNYYADQIGTNYYFGTDRIEITPFLEKLFYYRNIPFSYEAGIRSVLYDEVVSAPPISAKHRRLVPYFEIGARFTYLGIGFYIKDRFSLPTIEGDDGVFGLLSAGLSYDLE